MNQISFKETAITFLYAVASFFRVEYFFRELVIKIGTPAFERGD